MPLPARIRLHHAGVDGKTLTPDQAFFDATLDDLLEDKTKGLRLAEATVAVLRERRMIRHRVRDTQPADSDRIPRQ
jgi:hypothetical protein